MKKLITLLLSGAIVFVLNGVGFGGEYTFTPKYGDIDDLDHYHAYSWEIDMTAEAYEEDSEEISSIVLTFNDIRNHNNDANKLFLSVLDSPDVDMDGNPDVDKNGNILDWDGSYMVRHETYDRYNDTNDAMDNYFTSNANSDTGNASELLSIVNMDDSANDITITFTSDKVTISGADGNVKSITETSDSALADLFKWAQDGVFELGFDPDCHFYNNGVSLTVHTSESQGGSHAPEPETLVLFGFGLLSISAFGRKRFSSMS